MKRFYFLFCVFSLFDHSVLASLSDGLVAYYPFNGNANDASGNGNNGTVHGATLTNDRFGNPNSAYSFDGSSYIDVPESDSLELTNDFTLSAWINCQYLAPGTSGDILSKHMAGINDDGSWIFEQWLTGTIEFEASPTYQYYTYSSTLLSAGTWHHVAFTYSKSSSAWNIYIDGLLNNSGSYPYDIQKTAYDLIIGSQQHPTLGFYWYFYGDIDDIRIYNRALSGSEILGLFNMENSDNLTVIENSDNLTAGLEAVSTAQTTLPMYGSVPAPTEGQNSLVLITHGWINELQESTELPEATEFVNSTSNSIVQYLVKNKINNWNVQGYMWANQAETAIPTEALNNAEQQGKMVGDSIVQKGYTDVHFIAHSAGAGLIQKATEEIKATSLVPVTIHCTFLDAYDGLASEMAYEYGAEADWADSYFVRDEFQKYGWTGVLLPNAYNVDVTTLDPNSSAFDWYESVGVWCSEQESNHGWPPSGFYPNSIGGAITGNPPNGYDGFGFPLSDEAGVSVSLAKSQYPPGNGVLYGSVKELGPDVGCIPPYVVPSQYIGTVPGFSSSSSIASSTGVIQTSPGFVTLGTDSPVWLATVITNANVLNYVSFDAEFTSAAGAGGLLTVYWDTNMIGQVDEAAVLPGLQHYEMQFPNTLPNISHILGFHVDPFTEVHSTIILTNIATGCVGVSQQPILTANTSGSNGLLTYQLAGQEGTYAIQSSVDLVNWVTIAYLANTNGTVSFVDQNSTTNQYQFYRAIVPTMMSQ